MLGGDDRECSISVVVVAVAAGAAGGGGRTNADVAAGGLVSVFGMVLGLVARCAVVLREMPVKDILIVR